MVDKYTSAAIEGNKKFYITITNEAIKQKVEFKPFIESFSDNFTIKTTPTEVYGRMDAIQSYQNTARAINLSFAVPSVSIDEAKLNLQKIQSLIRFQYPIYSNALEEDPTIAGILAPPLCSIILSNFTSFNSSNGKLYGYFSNVNYTPDFSPGTTLFMDGGNIYPQLYKITLQMTIIHVDQLGWKNKTKGYVWRGDKKDDSTKKSDDTIAQIKDSNEDTVIG